MLGLDKKFRALSDPTRLAILRELRERPRNAGEIAERLSVAPSALSFHLRVLREADLVSDRRQGQFVLYALNTSVLDDVVGMLFEHFGAGRGGKRRKNGAADRREDRE